MPSVFLTIVLLLLFVSLPLQAEEYPSITPQETETDMDTGVNAYGEAEICLDDDDEDSLPINVIEERYAAGRMAFLFGQYEVAYKAWFPLAEEGYSKALASLGWMYYTGNGANKDLAKAAEYFRAAADQGHSIAQNNLGVMYENGQLGQVNFEQAAFWYKQAANVGYSYAQYNLGMLYLEGKGVKKDLGQASYWLRIAARQKVEGANAALKRIGQLAVKEEEKPKKEAVAHAPYHSNPVTKGLAWIKAQSPSHYTIQLARSKDIDWILAMAAKKKLEHTLVQYSTYADGEEWFQLIYGSFASRAEATEALKQLPEGFEKWSPWVKSFADVHKQLESKKQIHNLPVK